MAYGREILRKAGDRIRQFDDAYSEKLNERLYDISGKIEERGPVNTPTMAALMAAGVLSSPSTRRYRNQMDDGSFTDVPAWAGYGIPAASATAKYVVPGAAAGLAVKGIYDVTQMVSPYDQQTDGTLGL